MQQERSQFIELGIGTQLIGTSNANFGSRPSQSDAILQDRSRASPFAAIGPRLQVSGFAALDGDGVCQADRGQPLAAELPISPRGCEAIERWLFIEGGRALDPDERRSVRRAPASAAGRPANTLTTAQGRLSPYHRARLRRADALSPAQRQHLDRRRRRARPAWTSASAAGYFGLHTFVLERDPVPFGARLEAERSDTRYDNSVQDDLTIDVARVIATYALTDDLRVGLRGGYEQTNLVSCDGWLRHLRCRMEMAALGAHVPHRLRRRPLLRHGLEPRVHAPHAATGLEPGAIARHRHLAAAVVQPARQQQRAVPGGRDVHHALSRPGGARARGAGLHHQQSLATSTRGPTTIYAQRFSLVDSRIGSVAWLGTRNTVALSGFYVKTRDAARSWPAQAPATPSPTTCSTAGPFTVSHQLSPRSGLGASIDWSRIRAPRGGGHRRVDAARRPVAGQPPAHSEVHWRRGHPLSQTDSRSGVDSDEFAVFVGLDHRF